MKKVCVFVMAASCLLLATATQASLIFDGDVTPDVYLTNGVNGSWTISRENGIELGLRAKVRYPTPSNTFNSSGNGTYSHLAGIFNNRALWNYEFAANVDYDGTSGLTLADLNVVLGVDDDPSEAANLYTFRVTEAFLNNKPLDHTTIAQNSQNIGSLPKPPYNFDLTQEGTYDFELVARRPGSQIPLAQTTMRVIVSSPPPSLLGDYNQDGTVDAADYVLWRKNDINSQQGYDDWRANFGQTLVAASTAAASPEPTSLALLLIGGLLASCMSIIVRSRRSRRTMATRV